MKTKKILAGMISFLMMVSSFSMHNIGLSVCSSAITANAETEDSSENSDDVIMLHTESEAIDYVYSNMINRRSNITFSYASEENLDFDFVNEILNKVFEHNSSPSGGDYLRWQAKNITSELYIEEIENTKKYTISYDIKYLTTYEQEEYVDQRTDEIINQLDLEDKNDYEKVDAIYKYICNNISYDYENLSDSSYTKKYTAYAALADGTCVCEGYTLLLYNMLLKAGIDCRIIVGNAGCFMEGFEDYEYHAWNIVGLDGKYYNVDSTWDSGLDNYEWFLLSDETFNELEAKGHKPDEEYITESFQNKYPMSDVDNPYEEELSGLHNEIKWKLYKGRLELSGYGEINGNLLDYPWSNYISKVKEIVVNEGITSIGNYAFYDATYLKSVTLPNSLKHIGINSFSNCMSLEEVIIPDSVEKIDSYAFNCCYNLKTAILSKNIAVLSEGVFSGCENLNEIDIPNSVTRIEKNSLSAQGLTRIEIPSSVKYIGSLAFEGSNINEIYIPDSVEVIDGGAFSSCSINKINVSENNSAFCTKDNVLYNKEMKKLISYPAGLESDTFSVPIGVKEIADYAFEHSWNIKNIYFPDTLKVIGSNSFENCMINSCDFPEALKSIGNEAFRNCKLVKIEIPTSLDYLGVAAFSGNTDLEKVVIHNGITIIPERVFEGTGLKSIELPDSIEQIEMGAFSFCKALTSLDTNHVKDIGEIAFWCCDSLENIRFDSDLRSIGNQSFEGCTNLKILYVDSEKLTIGTATFNNCNNLQKIYYIGDIESWNNNVKISDENNECIFNTEIDCYKETSSTTTTSTTTTTQPVTTTSITTTSKATTTSTTTTSTTTTTTTSTEISTTTAIETTILPETTTTTDTTSNEEESTTSTAVTSQDNITETTTTAITTLPQTGYSDIYNVIIYGTGILTLLGVATIVLSKRKED